MSTSDVYDCVVIGAGVQGSFTAYELAKRRKRTVLLEQFLLPHTRGSSHGQTRIIRKAYEQDFYIPMMHQAYQLWAQMERETGVKLYRQTGLLVMGPPDSHAYQQTKATMLRNQIPLVPLSRGNFSQHIPNVNLPEGNEALVDVGAGILYADRALKTARDQFEKLGGVIRDNEAVTGVEPGAVVTVTTAAGVYRAKSVVITVGAWANRVLAQTGLQLPLEVMRMKVCYWREKVPGTYDANNRFPCFILTEGEESEHHIYGLPSHEYPGLVKVCNHLGVRTDPDQRDRDASEWDVEVLKRFVARVLPGLVPEPAVVETCMYTMTPDSHFVLDRHPAHSNIVIGAGFSGHGFKFGPLIGKLLCELSQGEEPSHDLSPFRIARFRQKIKSAL
ncbi:peroxisomal sarcosine oxidase [Takifugu rubripes]|uniref:Peroxisomal sarcosine oxidase n=1 Tax=Takifugu rubripes TaxID=31033 RepID=H2RK59_TAKRU|nr:peroxisomal sarcosine oxidase [Takifugu rubripes]